MRAPGSRPSHRVTIALQLEPKREADFRGMTFREGVLRQTAKDATVAAYREVHEAVCPPSPLLTLFWPLERDQRGYPAAYPSPNDDRLLSLVG